MKWAPLMIILSDGVSAQHPVDRALIRGREQSAISLRVPGEGRREVKVAQSTSASILISSDSSRYL